MDGLLSIPTLLTVACRPAPNPIPPLVALATCIAIPIAVRSVLTHPERRVLIPEPRCGRCGYDLHGLDPCAACPECGAGPDARDGPAISHRCPSKGGWVDLLLVLSPLLLFGWIPAPAVAARYAWRGYQWSTGWTIADEIWAYPICAAFATVLGCVFIARVTVSKALTLRRVLMLATILLGASLTAAMWAFAAMQPASSAEHCDSVLVPVVLLLVCVNGLYSRASASGVQ